MTSPPQCFCQQSTEGPLEEGTRVLNGVWSVLLMPSGKIKKEPAWNLVEWGSLVYLEKASGVLCLEMPHHSCSCWHGGELCVEKPRGWCHRVRKCPSAPLCLPHTYTLIPYLWTSCLLWWGRDSCSFLFFLPQEAFVTGNAAQEATLSITKTWQVLSHICPLFASNQNKSVMFTFDYILIAQIVHTHVLLFRKMKLSNASEIFFHGHLLPATKPKALPKDDIITVWGMYPSLQFFAWFAFA